ncbi:hypothetical protein KJ765_00950 [Candidatus Micrarchaeota archaeon]|nr:hypothetical protein [Candidatus Micrarchaeota archaeon]
MKLLKRKGVNLLVWGAIALVIILGIWYLGFKTADTTPSPSFPTPDNEPVPTASPPSLTATPAPSGGELFDEGEAVAPAPAGDEDEFALPECGDAICQADERCDLCPADCGCVGNEFCSGEDGLCYESEE